ncbi:hypothetical protein NHQ30_011703, partial [Ciborinia camelliae]
IQLSQRIKNRTLALNKAQDLLEAIVWDYRMNSHDHYSSLSQFVAEFPGTDDSSFNCSDDRSSNQCFGYGLANHACDPNYGPAGKMILASFSWINSFYAPVDSALTRAGLDGLAGVGELATDFIQYKKPAVSATEILGFISELLLPVGAGQMFAKTFSGTVNSLAADALKIGKPPSYKASQISLYYLGKMNDYKLMGNQMGFEIGDAAEQILALGKSPVEISEGALGIINEVTGFDELVDNVVTKWGDSAQTAVANLFDGITSADTITNGVSNYATLLGMIADGAWSRDMAVGDIAPNAATSMFSHLIPSLFTRMISVRPYACGGKNSADADLLFGELFTKPFSSESSDSAVSLSQYPNLCFFLLDANKDGTGRACGRAGCDPDVPKKLTKLFGMVHSVMTGGTEFGGLVMEDYVTRLNSLYEGWVANGKKNGAPTYKIDPKAPGGSLGNLYDNPITSAGLFNSYIHVCGNDTSGIKMDKNKNSPDMDLISENILSAIDAIRAIPILPESLSERLPWKSRLSLPTLKD